MYIINDYKIQVWNMEREENALRGKNENYIFYNPELKKEFIENGINNKSDFKVANAKRAFKRSSEIEAKYKKDIYEYTNQEFIELVATELYNSIGSIRTHLNVWNSYRKYNNTSRNIISINDIIEARKCKGFVPYSEKLDKIFTRNEINNYIQRCRNAQDAVLLCLLFEGININEFAELKPRNFNFDKNTVEFLNKRKEIRIIRLENKVMEIVKNSINESEYHSEKTTQRLKGSKYLARITYKDGNGKLSSQTVIRRLNEITKVLGADKKFTQNALNDSGILFYIEALKEKNGYVTYEEYAKVLKRYGYSISGSSNRGMVDMRRKMHEDYRKYIFNEDEDKVVLDDEILKVLESIVNIKLTESEAKTLHKHRKSKLEKDNLFESPWASEKIERGKFGEKYIYEKLKEAYSKQEYEIINVKDYYGYDIQLRRITDMCEKLIEVKTTMITNDNCSFFISLNELKTASENKEKYSIYVVVLKNNCSEKIVENVYEIENPIEELNFTVPLFGEIGQDDDKKDIVYYPSSYRINIKTEYLERFSSPFKEGLFKIITRS